MDNKKFLSHVLCVFCDNIHKKCSLQAHLGDTYFFDGQRHPAVGLPPIPPRPPDLNSRRNAGGRPRAGGSDNPDPGEICVSDFRYCTISRGVDTLYCVLLVLLGQLFLRLDIPILDIWFKLGDGEDINSLI